MKIVAFLLSIIALVSAEKDACNLLELYKGDLLYGTGGFEYDADANHCYRFIHSDDEELENIFPSYKECTDRCKKSDPCAMKPYSGRVNASLATPPAIELWTYRAEYNDCVQYIYSGVRGNRNRFQTSSECLRTCNTLIKHVRVVYRRY